jgi:hypothetical protein
MALPNDRERKKTTSKYKVAGYLDGKIQCDSLE